MQLTTPAPTDGQCWNWKANIAEGRNRLSQGRGTARAYAGQISRTRTFTDMVNQINADRARQRLQAITVTIPPFTAAQVEDDAIRAYNGFGNNRDVFGLPLHEFRLVMAGGVPQLTVDPTTNTGTAQWERVPVAARGTSGNPNYVANVQAADPRCGGP